MQLYNKNEPPIVHQVCISTLSFQQTGRHRPLLQLFFRTFFLKQTLRISNFRENSTGTENASLWWTYQCFAKCERSEEFLLYLGAQNAGSPLYIAVAETPTDLRLGGVGFEQKEIVDTPEWEDFREAIISVAAFRLHWFASPGEIPC